ncbi:DWNN-domain-containing protein [Lophiostoma macrostomum CBS 122681]|uniref:DWNN-domain-containing protein n=1 Tax=Lophiostoma macrostomum CBS 122681 TaxID=1314788 RepID=A0A6A6T398_9PLEO|nr:DWNN-domain-containing protein [Lophiostoma macrostomum CBS 122681]
MSSSVFYKFRNSKDPERITFHGTTITVFELKREIMLAARLGDGTDIDLHIYPEDQPNSEYTDDTTIIPRSSTVIARRRPAQRGQGRAARYVSARAPVRAIRRPDAPRPTAAAAPGRAPQTDQEREEAFQAESAQLWEQQKESLSQAKPIHNKRKHVDVPAHDPPFSYVCYRCQQKGHWIQACPTNDDPDFKPAPPTKRTTGIPRAFLQTVAKPANGDLRGIRIDANGDYVQVKADTQTWEKFQEKRTAAATKAQAAENEQPGQKRKASTSESERPVQKRKTPPAADVASNAPSAPKAMREEKRPEPPRINPLDAIFGIPSMPNR